jgi:hypothetical protein
MTIINYGSKQQVPTIYIDDCLAGVSVGGRVREAVGGQEECVTGEWHPIVSSSHQHPCSDAAQLSS